MFTLRDNTRFHGVDDIGGRDFGKFCLAARSIRSGDFTLLHGNRPETEPIAVIDLAEVTGCINIFDRAFHGRVDLNAASDFQTCRPGSFTIGANAHCQLNGIAADAATILQNNLGNLAIFSMFDRSGVRIDNDLDAKRFHITAQQF